MAFTTTASGLQFEDTVVGTGAEAAPGRNVTVHYTGWLYENEVQGAKFDSGSPPFSRTLTRRPIEAMRSVHVEAKEVQCGVQARCG